LLENPSLIARVAIGKGMDIVKESGTGFAVLSQTAYFGRDQGLDQERAAPWCRPPRAACAAARFRTALTLRPPC